MRGRRAAIPVRYLLLHLWVLSFTINVDVLYQLKLYDIVGAICIMAFLKWVGLQGPRRDKSGYFLVALFLVTVLGALNTMLRGFDLRWVFVILLRLYRFSTYVAAFLIMKRLSADRRQLVLLLDTCLLAVLAQSALIILQAMGVLPILWSEEEQYYGVVYTGTLPMNHLNPVLFMSEGLAAVMARAGLLRPGSIARKSALGACSLAMVVAMLIGQSRSSFIALGALALTAIRRSYLWLVVTVLILGAIALPSDSHFSPVGLATSLWEERVVAESPTQIRNVRGPADVDRTRPYIWRTAWASLADNPIYLITGTGFQNFIVLTKGQPAAHNIYLHILGEFGIIGLYVFLRWILALWSRLGRGGGIGRPTAVVLGGRAFLLVLLTVGVYNETLYPSRATGGFFGFALVFLGIMANPNWAGAQQGRATGSSKTRGGRGHDEAQRGSAGRPGIRPRDEGIAVPQQPSGLIAREPQGP